MRIHPVIVTILLATSAGLSQSRSFTGEVMDSPCADMGSHNRMMQGVDAKNARDCAQKCVRLASTYRYVLYDPATKTVYQLDNQQKSGEYAGQKVSVKGTFDAASKTIHVESIEAR